MPDQEESQKSNSLTEEKVFEIPPRDGGVFLLTVLGVFFLLILPVTLGLALTETDELAQPLLCFFSLILGVSAPVYFLVSFIANKLKRVIFGKKGVQYSGVGYILTGKLNQICWQDVTRVRIRRVWAGFVAGYVDMITLETRKGKLFFNNVAFSSLDLVAIFRILVDRKEQYSNIVIEDECGWLEKIG